MRCRVLSMFVVVSLVGCSTPGGEVDGGGVDAGPSTTDAGAFDAGIVDAGTADAGPPPADPSSFTITFPRELHGPTEDRTRCVVVELGNNWPAKVGALELHTTGPSFAVELYATDEDLAATPGDCAPLRSITQAGRRPLLLSYRHDETITFPSDVAFSFPAQQRLLFVMHSFNDTNAAEESTATVTLRTHPTATKEARFVMLMNADATVPAKLSALTSTGVAAFSNLSDHAHFFSVAAHAQRFGTEFSIALYDAQLQFQALLVNDSPYDFSTSARWSGTPFTMSPAHAFRMQCTWVNPLSVDAHSGGSADDLLCALGAYYWGVDGPQLCAITNTPTAATICCPGDAKCGSLF